MPRCPPSLGYASAGKPRAATGRLCCGAVTALPAPCGCPSLGSSLGVLGQQRGKQAGSHPNFQPCTRLLVKVRLRRLQRDMKWEGQPQRGAARAPAVRRAGHWQNRIWLCSERCF